MSRFDDLPKYEQMSLKLEWLRDETAFCKSPYGLSLDESNVLEFEPEWYGLWPAQEEIIKEFYHPTRTYIYDGKVLTKGPYNELWLIAGMRSSKTWIEGTIGAIDTFKFLNRDYRKMYGIAPSSPVFGLCVASKEDQAKDTNFAQYKARLQDSAYFQSLIEVGLIKLYTTSILFPEDNLTFKAVSSAVAGEVGKTILDLLVDEIDSFEDTGEGKRSGTEMYRRLTKGTKTFRYDGHSIFCGSPWYHDSMSMQKIEEAKTDPHMLAYHKSTWEMNPKFRYEDFERDFKKDPIGAMRDWGADPQAGVEVYFRDMYRIKWSQHENVLLKMLAGEKVVPGNFDYVFTGDPAGPRSQHNGFGMALGHREGNKTMVDGVIRYQPKIGMEIDPIKLLEFMLDVVTVFPVIKAAFDTWNYPIAQERLRRKGVVIENQILRAPEYEIFKERAYGGLVDMPFYEPLEQEMKTLLRASSGRIDHPRRGSKDVIDAVVQLTYQLSMQQSFVPMAKIIVI